MPAPPLPSAVSRVPTTSNGPSHRIRLVPHLDNRRSLRFEAISRDLKEGDVALRIGRFTDRSGQGLAAANALSSNKLAFKSKVVSRAHAEVWVETGGKFFIKDTKSSSGTFLNHTRLSSANQESKPHQIKDGDILQLGVDYQGGTEDIYKSVKIRIEVGREWQAGANAFNTNAMNNLKTLAVAPTASAASAKVPKSSIPDCCICLFSVTIRQALFIAPCSHTFHYKCIRPMLDQHHPAFSCPLCRTYADLEEDVEVDCESEEEAIVAAAVLDAIPAPLIALEREREREIAAGVETEVENDMPTGSRRFQNSNNPFMMPVVDLTEPDRSDDDMGEEHVRGGQSRGTMYFNPSAGNSTSRFGAAGPSAGGSRLPMPPAGVMDDEMDFDVHEYIPPVAFTPHTTSLGLPPRVPSRNGGSRPARNADSSEGEGTGSSGEGLVVDVDGGNVSGGEDAGALGSKRKR